MSKILKAILICAYGAVIIQFMTVLRMDRYETVLEINYVFRNPGDIRKIERALKKNKNITAMFLNYTKPERLPTDLKFILKYSKMYDIGFKYTPFTKGQQPFIDGQCEYHNCYFTTDKSLVGDLRNFDAIVFDVEYTWEAFPIFRAPHQKYIFTAMESSDNYPVCNPVVDNFFNWTWSYRLDSDVVWTYISIYDNNNTIIGPKINMTWLKLEHMAPTTEKIKNILANKKKMAAWFVSYCDAKSDRMNMTVEINHYLQKSGYEVDIFGRCGTKACPKSRMEDCLELLQDSYHFYFAFENTNSVDYVTEKLLHAVKHYTMPVVYGGSDYSRFLPPGSYIDASTQEPYVTASIMIDLVKNKEKYYNSFRWHNHYMYKESPDVADVCLLCKLLNVQVHSTVVKNLRQWWLPDYRKKCGEERVEQRVDDLVKKTAKHLTKSQGL